MSERPEEKIYFSTLKEGRADYFVEYCPPRPSWRFATLQLVFFHRSELPIVADAMEREAVLWHDRFPVSVMVSAFDEVGDLIHLDGVRQASHLMAFAAEVSGQIGLHWQLVGDDALPSRALNRQFLLETYSKVERKTQSQLRDEASAHSRKLRTGWTIVFLWIAVGPAAFLPLEFFGPKWFATLVFIFGISQALVKILRMLGKWKPLASEAARAEEERRMRHHHYHCERNPDGFLRLKLDNFEREQREEIRREAESVTNVKHHPAD